MKINEINDYLLESQDPAFAGSGKLVAWVSSPKPERRILAIGRGDTIAEACHSALADWIGGNEIPRTTGEVRTASAMKADLAKQVA